jgi:hypothetical protein
LENNKIKNIIFTIQLNLLFLVLPVPFQYIENKPKLKNNGTTTRRRSHQQRSTTTSTWASKKPPEQQTSTQHNRKQVLSNLREHQKKPSQPSNITKQPEQHQQKPSQQQQTATRTPTAPTPATSVAPCKKNCGFNICQCLIKKKTRQFSFLDMASSSLFLVSSPRLKPAALSCVQ